MSASSSPTNAPASTAHCKLGSLSRVVFADALPPHVLHASQPLFSKSLAGACAPDFIACLGAALRLSPTPTRFYFIVYFDTNSTIDIAMDSIAPTLGPVVAVACYWITTAFDMARFQSPRSLKTLFARDRGRQVQRHGLPVGAVGVRLQPVVPRSCICSNSLFGAGRSCQY